MSIKQWIEELYPQSIRVRRELRQHLRPSFKEYWTSAYVCDLLDEWGISCEFPVAGMGIVVMIQGEKPGSGNTVAFWIGMNALPLAEDIVRPFRSLHPGHVHAYGHDIHTAIAPGTARVSMESRSEWSECVKFFFQPVEGTTEGALPMMEADCMESPHVDYITGLYVIPTHGTGEAEIRYGDLNASSNEVRVEVHGKSCRGAYPDTGADAIVMATVAINSLQTLVNRYISPLDSTILTLGTIHSGVADNTIVTETKMTGTLRTTNPAVKEKIIDAMIRRVDCTCQVVGDGGEVAVVPGYATFINSDEAMSVLVEIAEGVLGSQHIHLKKFPSLGVGDSLSFLEKAKGIFYHLGYTNREKSITAPLHSQGLDIDEEYLRLKVQLQAQLALKLLKRDIA